MGKPDEKVTEEKKNTQRLPDDILDLVEQLESRAATPKTSKIVLDEDLDDEEDLEDGTKRTVLHFHPALAPVKIGVLPLSKKLNEGAEKVYTELSKYYNCEFDDRGNIGKRYRRQDEIGTPFCVTYDFESEEDGAVTVRDRDTMQQERVKIEDLKAYFEKKFEW